MSQERRSENMRRIRSKGMAPELAVRSMVHRLGYRFRLHRRDLPGTPDLVFPKAKAVIFVHGCFWHQHSRCRDGRVPSSNKGYWLPKLETNVARDRRNRQRLRRRGWTVLIIWECEIKELERVRARIVSFLENAELRNSSR